MGRHVVRRLPNVTKSVNEAMKTLPKFDVESMATARYYKGGFDPKMNRREAALILGELVVEVICFIYHIL